ncbi:MAG: AraC family transcriptional regulator [Planctomycetes bacterium]|nr:AraC family transcriptional regulator [Planctomycetota bacterium]
MPYLAHNPPRTPWVRTDEPLFWLVSAGHELFAPGEDYLRDASRRRDPHYVIQLTLRGEGFYEREGKTTLLKAGMAFIEEMPADFRYGIPVPARDVYEHAWLDLNGPAVEMVWRDLIRRHGRVVHLGAENPVAPLLKTVVYQHAQQRHHDRYRLSAQLYEVVMTLLHRLDRQRVAAAPLAQRAAALIHARGLLPDCSVEALAESLDVSREHLSRTFREALGVSPADYLVQHRLRHARRLLLESDAKLEAIARASGFSGANYFCRVFRQHVGRTPDAYRKLG